MNQLQKLWCYREFSLKAFQKRVQYRGQTFLFALGDGIKFILLLVMWKAIFNASSTSQINGITWDEMKYYVLLTMLLSYFIEMPFLGVFGSKIIDGNITMDLIRPIDIQLMLLADVIGQQISNFIIICLPISIGIMLYLGEVPTLSLNLFNGIIALFLGFLTAFSIDYLIGTIGFWTTNVMGLQGMKRLIIQVASGALMPLTLLPDWLYHLVKYLPFQGILYVPLQCFLGKITGKDAYLVLFQQFIWVIILILIGRMFFKIASRKITIFGG
ncbi:hypothetical protein BVG00_22625 [Bacillus cereus]|uniref:ABC transporter permease n=2 Tax=Bacillus cereus TaxID=1396 RepID=UPI0009CBA5E4|nr:ABC-2 family transporter protein [Bacillus cereus]NSL61110.1 ABC-2 family transporter protein [Bacillus cereus]OPD42619.1 hypothetical protein BVG00_22625 [Bacillus cereus]